jgi:hypothetical protein
MSHHAPALRLITLCTVTGLCLSGVGLAAETEDVPTYEQIEAVTKTTEVDGEDEAYALDDVVVNATRRAEVAYRHIQIALERRRSDKLEDADLTVCRKVTRPGSHILQTMCATNRTWNYIRMKSTRDVLGDVRGGYAPYPVTEGPVYRINQGYLNKMSQRFDKDTDHSARVKQLMAAEAAERMTDEHGTAAEEVARFATAFSAISKLKSADDAALERVIVHNGLTVERYNELVARLETSPRFKERVSFAIQAAH